MHAVVAHTEARPVRDQLSETAVPIMGTLHLCLTNATTDMRFADIVGVLVTTARRKNAKRTSAHAMERRCLLSVEPL
jgi:hypothetical protein